MPFFSIIIPSYNRASIVERAINSVLAQSYLDFEILVVDDGSTDSTQTVVSSISDSRIRYVFQENKGVCAARNHGASLAKGEYLVFLDSDDYVTEDWLHYFQKEIETSKNVDLVFCDMEVIHLYKNIIKTVQALYPYQENTYTEDGLYLAGTFCVKTTFFYAIGNLDENLKFGEFTEFGFRSRIKNPTQSFTKKTGLLYEISTDGGSKNSQNRIDSNLYIIQKHPWFFEKYPHALRLYYQNVGVAYFRLSNWKMARTFFWKAFWIQPWKLKTLIRFVISFHPDLAQKVIK